MANSAKTTNSRFIKVIAPWWIVWAICATRPSPPEDFRIVRNKSPAITSPKTPISGVAICRYSSMAIVSVGVSTN